MNKKVAAVAAFVLWLGTAALGMWQIVLVRDIILSIYARLAGGEATTFGLEYWRAHTLSTWIVFILAFVWIALVIGGGEYHYRHVGRSRSWKLFGWTIGAQLGILVLAFFLL
jgi:hypothetical protein